MNNIKKGITMMNSEHYYDSIASHYDGLYFDGLSLAENAYISDLIAADIRDIGKNCTVLDLGCGTGLGLDLLTDRGFTDIDYRGSDISSKMIQEAEKKFRNHPKAKFSVDDMSDLGRFPDASVDYIFSLFGSFSHSMEYGRTISEINRVLKPSGKVLIMTYSRNSLRNVGRLVFGLKWNALRFIQPYDVRNNAGTISCPACFYTPQELGLLFGGFGFENIEVNGLNFVSEFELIKRLIGRNQKSAKRWLKTEQIIFANKVSLGHSLILRGKKSSSEMLIEYIRLRA